MRNLELWAALYLTVGLGLAAALRLPSAGLGPAGPAVLTPVLITLFWPIFVPLAALSPARSPTFPRPRESEARALIDALQAVSDEAPPGASAALEQLGPALLRLAQRADRAEPGPPKAEDDVPQALRVAREAQRRERAQADAEAEARWVRARDASAELCARLEHRGATGPDDDPTDGLHALLDALLDALRLPDDLPR
jgi:hypothetical protein